MLPSYDLKIPIIVYLPSKYVIKLSVLPSTRLCDLFRAIPSKDISYVHNGSLLSNNQTFISAGINPGDSIVLVFKNNKAQSQFYNSNIYLKENNFNQNVYNKTPDQIYDNSDNMFMQDDYIDNESDMNSS